MSFLLNGFLRMWKLERKILLASEWSERISDGGTDLSPWNVGGMCLCIVAH